MRAAPGSDERGRDLGGDAAAPEPARTAACAAARKARVTLECATGFDAGARALLWALPPDETPTRAGLLCVQPWLGESNFSRRTIVLQARRLADRGIAVLLVDPFGTGDSAGDLVQATLDRWLDDLVRACALLRARIGPTAALGLWGVRGGALLAERIAGTVGATLLLAWHPLASGAEQLGAYRRLAKLGSIVRSASTGSEQASIAAETEAASTAKAAGSPPRASADTAGTDRTAAASTVTAGAVTAGAVTAGAVTAGAVTAGAVAAGTVAAGDTPASGAAEATSGRRIVEMAGDRLQASMVDALAGLRHVESPGVETVVVEGATTPFWIAPEADPGDRLFLQTEARLEAWLTAQRPAPISETTSRTRPTEPSAAADAPPIERPLEFDSDGRTLRGMLHAAGGTVGVVVVAGQPQTRAGSHRMFVRLARALASAGHPTLRYDLAGHGDSDGESTAFDQTPDDVRAAIEALRRAAPTVRRVVAWGLCDGATAAALALGETAPAQAATEPAGLVLLNPWVHDETLRARAVVGGHYLERLRSAAFWRKLVRGEFAVVDTAREAFGHLRRLMSDADHGVAPSPAERLRRAIERLAGPACLLLSGRDMTASEMEAALASDTRWQRLPCPMVVHRLPQADHTLSRSADLEQAIAHTLEFLRSLDRPA